MAGALGDAAHVPVADGLPTIAGAAARSAIRAPPGRRAGRRAALDGAGRVGATGRARHSAAPAQDAAGARPDARGPTKSRARGRSQAAARAQSRPRGRAFGLKLGDGTGSSCTRGAGRAPDRRDRPGAGHTSAATSTVPGSAILGPSDGGRMGARTIYRPKPEELELPEALRHRTIELVAVARFRVGADGSARVELVEPTSDSALNRALLVWLRRFRFFPGMQDGKPIVSTVDIRVPISVR